MAQFLTATGCLIKHQNRFLIIKRPEGVHAAGTLSFPGGGVEFLDGADSADILRQATKREVLEEVGIDIKDPIEYLTSSYFVDDFGNNALFVVFYCELKETAVQVAASEREVPEYFWMTAQEIVQDQKAPEWLVRYICHLA